MDPLTQALMMQQQGQPQQGAPSPPGQGQPPMGGGVPPSPVLQQLLGGMGQGQPPPQQGPMGPPPQTSPQAGPPPTPVVPPNPPTRIPPQVKRFNNVQQIQDSIRNNWTPNPTLLRATLGNK